MCKGKKTYSSAVTYICFCLMMTALIIFDNTLLKNAKRLKIFMSESKFMIFIHDSTEFSKIKNRKQFYRPSRLKFKIFVTFTNCYLNPIF